MQFKEGDEVVFIKNRFAGRWRYRDYDIKLGYNLKIIGVDLLDKELQYQAIYEDGNDYWFNEDELELLEGCFIDRVKPKGKKRG